jgi:hypothetical protein
MNYKTILKIMVIIIIIGGIVFAAIEFLKNSDKNSVNNEIPIIDTKILGNSYDLVSFSVDPGDKVSGVLNVVGSVQGGYFFEGNILINVLDLNKKVIRKGNGNAITDWMTTDPVGFNAAVDFNNLPKGGAYIEIRNDNPGAPNEGINKSILIPVIIE